MTKTKQMPSRLACAAHNFYQNTEPHTLNLHWFLFHLALLSTQNQGSFPYRSIWEMAGLKTGATLPVLQWFGIKWHAHVFQPPHGLFGEIYAPCCGFIQDTCVCAMRKVQWAHAGNMQAFVGIFLFFPGAAFDSLFFFLSGILSVVELLCIPGEITAATLLVSFDLAIRMACYYFCGGLLNYLHLSIWKTLCLKRNNNNNNKERKYCP